MLLKYRAFSFLELLIAIAILGVLMSVAVLPIQKLISTYQEKIFFNQLLYDIDAIRDTTRLNHSDGQIDFLNDYYEIKISGQSPVQKSYPKFLSLQSGGSLAFAVTGVPKKAGTITFYNKKGKIFQIVLAPVTGRVRLDIQ